MTQDPKQCKACGGGLFRSDSRKRGYCLKCAPKHIYWPTEAETRALEKKAAKLAQAKAKAKKEEKDANHRSKDRKRDAAECGDDQA